MKKEVSLLVIGAALTLTTPLFSMPIVQTDTTNLSIGGRMHLLSLLQTVRDPYKNNTRAFLFLKQSRLFMDGQTGAIPFRVEFALGGEEEVKASTGVSLSLLDYYAELPLWQIGSFRIGQFTIPYSRERLEYPEHMPFTEPSIQNLGFQMGRDIGVAKQVVMGPFAAAAGIFAGGGRDVPERYIPEVLGFPLYVARIGLQDGETAFAPNASPVQPKQTRTSIFFNGLYTNDSSVGHSTVLNVKLSEKPLLLNPNWNPFLAQAPLVRGSYWQVGGDVSWAQHVGWGTVSAEGEINTAYYSNAYGSLRLTGGRVQAVANTSPFELAARYAFLLPSTGLQISGVQITGSKAIQQVSLSLGYALADNVKLVAELPILIDVPVVIEKGVGSYILTQQPDQTTVLKTAGNTVERQTVMEERLSFQMTF